MVGITSMAVPTSSTTIISMKFSRRGRSTRPLMAAVINWGMRVMVMMYAATWAAAARNMTTLEVLAAVVSALNMSITFSSR